MPEILKSLRAFINHPLADQITSLTNNADDTRVLLQQVQRDLRELREELARTADKTDLQMTDSLERASRQLDLQGDLAEEIRKAGRRIALTTKASASLYFDQISEVTQRQQLGLRETIVKLRDERLSFARFGEGEFRLMTIRGFRLHFQAPSPDLIEQLNRTFRMASREVLRDGKLMIGFPHLFRDRVWTPIWFDVWPGVRELVTSDSVFGNSHITRPIFFQELGEEGVDLWRSVWDGRDVVLITGRGSRMDLVPELFDNISSTQQIDSLPKDAFVDIPNVLEQVRALTGREHLFLIALGPSGTILAHRISEMGEQAIDIGHISSSYEHVFRSGPFM